MIIVAGPSRASRGFAESLAGSLGARLVEAQHKVFPDGERYVRLDESLEGERVVVVQTLSPPQDSSLVEAMLLADAALGAGASSVELVAPYLAYARQDRRFLPGEPVSVSVVLKALAAAGYSRLYTVEVHKQESLRAFPGEAASLSPYEYMASKIGLSGDVLVLAPDIGALDRARRLAGAIGADYDYLVKRRDRVTGEIVVEPKEIPAKGRDVVIVDDIISTGGTVAKAASMLLEQGARSIRVMVAHALMVGGAVEKLRKAGVERVYAANTLPPVGDPMVEYVDVAPVVAEAVGG